MSEGPLPLKRDVAKMLLRKGSLFVHLDPRASDVIVPPWLRHQAQLVLQVGFDMPIPIPDLRVDDDGVLGTLSFSRTPFTCHVPWHAVFALVGDEGRGMVWPESMPAEIAAEVEREALRSAAAKPQGNLRDLTSKAPPPPPVKNVQPLMPESRFGAKEAEPGTGKRRRALPPYLRVVK